MILQRLALRNFRLHAQTDLEWPDGVVALVGRNGRGKSTLLEAIVFALYGTRALVTNKELVRSSTAGPSDPVEVRLELELDGQAVAIVRELRGRNLTPQATLTVDGAVLVPPGAGSDQAATTELQRRIGLGLDAFVTTVVTRQKDLDRLAAMKPAERKRLILDMLGVDRLDAAINEARSRRRSAEALIDTLRRDAPDPQSLGRAQDLAAVAVHKARGEVETAAQKWEEAKVSLAKSEAAAQQARQAEQERQQADQALQRAKANVENTRHQASQAHKQLQEAKAAAAELDQLTKVAAGLEDLAAEIAQAEEVQRRRQALDTLEKEVVAQRNALDALQIPADQAEVRAATHQVLDQSVRDAATAAAKATAAAARVAALQKQVAALDDLEAAATCPTCHQALTAQHRLQVRADLDGDLEHARTEQQAAALAEVEARHAGEAARSRAAALDQEESARRSLVAQKEARSEALAAAESRLATAQAAAEEAPLDDVAMAALRTRLQSAQDARDRSLRLEVLAESVPKLEAAADQAGQAEQSAAGELEAAAAMLARLPDSQAEWSAAQKDHDAAIAAEREQERRLLAAKHALSAAEQEQAFAAERVAEAKKREATIAQHVQSARYWGALAGARGGGLLGDFKEHIVARIGPAVSSEAGRLLAAFTQGRYTEVILDDDQGVFVTDGGVRYTLDRFSGGEQDLVHLALRLAVSRLLADRSGGAELSFLALDEVFGSLDRQRRDAVLGALQGLGGLYRQVVCITHLDDLREALDGCIEVAESEGQASLVHHA